MVRKGKQIQVRLRRVELANRLLEWLEKGQQLEGSHVHERVIIPFARSEEGAEGLEWSAQYEVWKAWDILKESGRRASSPGGHFTILCPDPIKADQFGNIIMNKDTKIPPAPTVYCRKDREQVPIWYCLGSLTQGREACSYLVKATVHGGESAEVECKWRESDEL